MFQPTNRDRENPAVSTQAMTFESLRQYVETLDDRVRRLYERANPALEKQPSLMLHAFKELGTAAEALQVAMEELLCQHENLLDLHSELERERDRYHILFNESPDAYLVTDARGIITHANRAALVLFNCPAQFLLGKPFPTLVPSERSNAFRQQLRQRQEHREPQEWELRLCSPYRNAFDAALTLSCDRDETGNVLSMRLCVRDITARVRRIAAQEAQEAFDPTCDRDRHCYLKGDIIPFKLDSLWIICEGWVKLSTLTENNEEIMMGIIGPKMPFGPKFTPFSIYQATAVSDTVELVCIPQAEIAECNQLKSFNNSQLLEHLHQTQYFLAVYGRRKIKHRLLCLLETCDRLFGDRVPQGSRLQVRLTHQELADACCTTRVTITRFLKTLQEEGKILFDRDNHIILPDAVSSSPPPHR